VPRQTALLRRTAAYFVQGGLPRMSYLLVRDLADDSVGASTYRRAMTPSSGPTPAARLLSHLLVGLAAGALVGKKTGPTGGVFLALLAVAAHQALDAPVAAELTRLGL
jgi:hypothetical protein